MMEVFRTTVIALHLRKQGESGVLPRTVKSKASQIPNQ